ncbi:hypothetical protein L210DRAFT_3735556 [Boletus edulis BED1]|uniref:Uncharacterized protein n=1 Tax=Boletus edulis BED1 TaxID=1328754 RepID=A0AAD4GHB6_BOLED|nr:hypothetical protein L210DRAFT_3735556 [Boletus edulis BED1]
MHEVDSELIHRAWKVVVDSRDDYAIEAGELITAGKATDPNANLIKLGELVKEGVGGKFVPVELPKALREQDGVTIFKSVRVGLQDVAIAHLVLSRAETRGSGLRGVVGMIQLYSGEPYSHKMPGPVRKTFSVIVRTVAKPDRDTDTKEPQDQEARGTFKKMESGDKYGYSKKFTKLCCKFVNGSRLGESRIAQLAGNGRRVGGRERCAGLALAQRDDERRRRTNELLDKRLLVCAGASKTRCAHQRALLEDSVEVWRCSVANDGAARGERAGPSIHVTQYIPLQYISPPEAERAFFGRRAPPRVAPTPIALTRVARERAGNVHRGEPQVT